MSRRQNNTTSQPLQGWLEGAIAGFVATVPMTIFMFATQRFLPRGQQYDLPPEIITKDLAHRMHVRQHMNKQQILGATLASHFGYGAAMGTLYRLFRQRVSVSAPIQGALFGLMVWAASYLGLLPLLGMAESGQKEPVRRNLMMIAAHVVWGAAMGSTADIIEQRMIT
jgi:uncharacterized membrane protein YagU involved in acid resistance